MESDTPAPIQHAEMSRNSADTEKQKAEKVWGQFEDLQAQHVNLISQLDMLSASIRNDGDNTAQAAIESARKVAQEQVKAHSGILENIPPVIRHLSSKGATVQRTVLATTELLEMILSNLPNGDLLKAYSVSRGFYSTIEGSLKLQRKLGLLADPETSNIYIPAEIVWSYDGWGLDIDVTDSAPDNVELQVYTAKLKALGKRCRSMLICQPPIHQISAYASCCLPYTSPKPVEVLNTTKGSSGITLGDLYDAMIRLQYEHRLCPDARYPSNYDKDGFVHTQVGFKAQLPTNDNDPLMIEHWERVQESNEKAKALIPLSIYVKAKKRGIWNALVERR
jgi:hypothetical protein